MIVNIVETIVSLGYRLKVITSITSMQAVIHLTKFHVLSYPETRPTRFPGKPFPPVMNLLLKKTSEFEWYNRWAVADTVWYSILFRNYAVYPCHWEYQLPMALVYDLH